MKVNLATNLEKSEHIVMGMMSGTSLDGADIVVCTFNKGSSGWKYKLLFSKTYHYNTQWKKSLAEADQLSSEKLVKLNRDYGNFLGHLANESIKISGVRPEIIASHGHTVFHKPDQGYSLQIGYGANIAAVTGVSVVADFRSADIAHGGQGAPLVPAGDKLLYGQYQSCLNLGGFSNISFDVETKRIAFDICPVNIVLNHLATKLGFDFDKEGILGRKGKPLGLLLEKLNAITYYNNAPPKSLSKEWLNKVFLPLIDADHSSFEDKLHTMYKHITIQIVSAMEKYKLENVFVTGGGVHNSYLMQLLKEYSKAKLTIPDADTVDFKEAIVFAFLGLLRNLNVVNCYASVTGAANNSVCGTVFLGEKKESESVNSLSNPNYMKKI